MSDVCVEASAELGNVVGASQGIDLYVDVSVSDWLNVADVANVDDEAPVELAVHVDKVEQSNETPVREKPMKWSNSLFILLNHYHVSSTSILKKMLPYISFWA